MSIHNTPPSLLPLRGLLMFGFLLLRIRLPRLIILRQFRHERGGQIVNSGIVRERGPQPSGGQRQLICAVPAAFLKIPDNLLDFSGAECAILWRSQYWAAILPGVAEWK